jgi:hypothetical protein
MAEHEPLTDEDLRDLLKGLLGRCVSTATIGLVNRLFHEHAAFKCERDEARAKLARLVDACNESLLGQQMVKRAQVSL